MLTIKNLNKSFGTQNILDGLNYNFKPNTIYALMGANGSGKTTLYNLINGFLSIDSGKLLFNETDITQLLPHQRANLGIARTFQDMRLVPSLTVYENILLAIKKKPSERLINAFFSFNYIYKNLKIEEILEKTHLKSVRNSRASDISYGQQKLLNLAVAMANEFELLLLDEPIAGVQPEFREEILTLIQSFNTTVIVIEHNPEFLEKLTDTILFLDGGKIIAEGDYNTIKLNKEVQEAYL